MARIVMEDGYYPEHDPDLSSLSRSQARANAQWFADNWQRLRVGGVMITNVGAYMKTARGFRKCSEAEAHAYRDRHKDRAMPLRRDGTLLTVRVEVRYGAEQSVADMGFDLETFATQLREIERDIVAQNGSTTPSMAQWGKTNDVLAARFDEAFTDPDQLSKLVMMIFMFNWIARPFAVPIEDVRVLRIEVPEQPDQTGHRIISCTVG